MAETELKKGKHSMKTILEKAKKWFASVHSEVPAFCKLCKVTIFLITKTGWLIDGPNRDILYSRRASQRNIL